LYVPQDNSWPPTNTGATLEAGVENGKTTLQTALGITFDPLTVTPDPNGQDLESRQYAAILGGLSELAETENPDAGNPDTDPLDTVIALINDASDGQVDGQRDGSAVTIEGSATTLRNDLTAEDVTQATTNFTSNPDNGDFTGVTSFTVSASTTGSGAVSPMSVSIFEGASVTFTLTPAQGSEIGTTSGSCSGTLAGNAFQTEALTTACQFAVVFDAIDYAVSVASVTGGSSSPASDTALFGETASIELIPDTGYELISASGCGGLLSGSTFTTGSITEDCEIVPVFELQQFEVTSTASPATGGSVNPEGPVTVSYGSELAVNITPAPGFELNSVDNGQVAGCEGSLSNSAYNFSAVTADCQLTANFTPISYTVSGVATGPGTISPASQPAQFGDTVTFTLSPNIGAGLFEVTAPGCQGSENGGTSYTTGLITSDCTVTGEFRNLFTITATAGTGGSIAPAGDSMVFDGEARAFDLTPDANFEIDTVIGCGGTLTDRTFITAATSGDCTVTATFVENDTPLPGAVWGEFNWDEAAWQ
jgi:hypothetical protein